MLSDVLKALELITDVIRSAKTPEKKRQRVAKQLLRIYLDVGMIVERGNDILSILKGKSSAYYDVAFSKLQPQQRALQNLIDDLHRLDSLAFLDIHLPHFKKNLKVLVGRKTGQIGFYLSQLTATGKELTQHELEYLWSQVGATDRNLLNHGLQTDFTYVEFTGVDFRMRHLRDREDFSIRVFTSARQIAEAEEALVKMEQLAEELRQFIIEKFEFEDVL